jgi:cytidylate kinase
MKDIIAVDGEAAAGKSVCATVAKKLGYELLETGIIYRSITLFVLRAGIDPCDTERISTFIEKNHTRLDFRGNKIALDGHILGDEIRTLEISKATPKIAKQSNVRKLILPLQREFNGGTRIIAEGRDIGSVVFPDARVKIYLTASLEIRAERRFKQYLEKYPSSPITIEETMEELRARDNEDKTRSDSPLVCLPEAVVIDSTDLIKEEVVNAMLAACQK